MIEAKPTRPLSRHYRVQTPAGPWAELRFDHHAGDASFAVEGRSYRARRLMDERLWRHVNVGQRGALARGLWADLAADVSAPVGLFVVWLLLCRWETLHTA